MNLEGYEPGRARPRRPADRGPLDPQPAGRDDRATTTADLEAFRFAEATRRLRDFTWNDFCDWYVEFVKGRLRDPEPAPGRPARRWRPCSTALCRLLHPIMPFVTEQVWQALGQVAPRRGLPEPAARRPRASASPPGPPIPEPGTDPEAEADRRPSGRRRSQALRNLRAERNVPQAAKIAPILVADGPVADALRQGEAVHPGLTGAAIGDDRPSRPSGPPSRAVAVLADAEIILPLEGLIDKEAERASSGRRWPTSTGSSAAPGEAGQRVVRQHGPRPRSSTQQRAKEAELDRPARGGRGPARQRAARRTLPARPR